MKQLRSLLPGLLIVMLLTLPQPAVQAATPGTTFTWRGVSGDFGDAGEWEPPDGPPGEGDEARLAGPGVTISFSADTEVDRMMLPGSTFTQVTFDLNGNTLTVSGASEMAAFKMESSAAHPNNTLTLTKGTLTLHGVMVLQQGEVSEANSQVFVSGDGAVLNTTTGRSILGFFGYSEVIVENGGVWHNQPRNEEVARRPDLDIGLNASEGRRAGKGLLRVTGPGSRYAGSTDPETPMAGQLRIRVGVEENAEGNIEVLAGGIFEADVVHYGTNPTSVGNALISGTGSSYTTKYTYLGGFSRSGGDFDPRGRATMTVSDGATATTGHLRVAAADDNTSGKLVLDRGTMTVTGYSGPRATPGAVFDPGAQLVVILHDKSDPAGLVATERLTITEAHLSVQLAPSFTAGRNDRFVLATYGALTGTFRGLPQESTLTAGNHTFRIDYGSGANDAITLTVLP